MPVWYCDFCLWGFGLVLLGGLWLATCLIWLFLLLDFAVWVCLLGFALFGLLDVILSLFGLCCTCFDASE